MTIVDPSHPKAQMALRHPTDSASNHDSEDLPSYAESSTSLAIASTSSNLAASSSNPLHPPSTSSSPFTPEDPTSLNPEARKKLTLESESNGRPIDDYGFSTVPSPHSPESTLPSFAEEEQADRPTYSIDSRGNIVSHSAKLNQNPIALLRFLRLHAESPPSLTIHLRGSHTEHRTETRYETQKDGRVVTKHVSVQEEVEDFEFYVDASEWVEKGLGDRGVKGLVYEVGGWEPTFRGGAWRVIERDPIEEGAIRLEEEEQNELEAQTIGRSHATPRGKWRWISLRRARKLWRQGWERTKRGMPAFVDPRSLVDVQEDERLVTERLEHPALLFRSHWLDLVESHSSVSYGLTGASRSPVPSPTYDVLVHEREKREEGVRNVIEQYCRCRSVWKELKIEKEVYGWRMDILESGIRSILNDEYLPRCPTGTVQVAIRVSPDRIVIRPENWISRVLSSPWYIKLVLSIFLVYPILLLLSYLLSHRFHNLRVAYPLTRWRRIPHLDPEADLDEVKAAAEGMRMRGERGNVRVAKVPTVPMFDMEGEEVGWVALVGIEETEAIKRWQTALREGVRSRIRGQKLGLV